MGPNPFEGFPLYLCGVAGSLYAVLADGDPPWLCLFSWAYFFLPLHGCSFGPH